jgi:Tfp pilus assembly protein PilX
MNMQGRVKKDQQKGAALLVMTLILMMAAGLIIVFATSYTILQQKTVDTQQDDNKAFAAAEAGMDYALAYLNANIATILATASGGSINYSFATVTQADNSTYSAVITNPTANNYTLLQITATGNSPDGTAVRVIRQQVYRSGAIVDYGVTTKQNVDMGGNSAVTGTGGVHAGANVSQGGSSSTSGVTENDSTISSMTDADFFTSIFGISYASMQASSTYYSSSSGVPWGSLSGSVWVNSAVSLSGNTTIGSAANPVVLIINGNFSVTGNVTVYGLVYVTGTASLGGNFDVNGGLIAEGDITMSGSSTIDYSDTILSNLTLPSGSGGGSYSKVPASWQDF